jgi:hypothetical protein
MLRSILVREQPTRGTGVDIRSSRALISGRREHDNLGDPPVIVGLDLRFDDSRHNRRGLHLGRTLYRLHMALVPSYSPRCGKNNTILCTNVVVLDALAHLACAYVGVIWKVRSTLSNWCVMHPLGQSAQKPTIASVGRSCARGGLFRHAPHSQNLG